MRRISVVGNSGSGKTTVARALAVTLGVPHLELDSIFHQAGWQPLDRTIFVGRVTEFTDAPGWVVDGSYNAVRDVVWGRADTVIILWAWTKHGAYRDRYLAAQADPANGHLRFVRVRSGRELSALLRDAVPG